MLMITITYDKAMAFMAFFTACCVAGGWLLKIIKAMKKPSDDINARIDNHGKMLDNDNKRIKELEDQLNYISSSIGVLMRCDLVILGHLRTNNNTGQMSKMEAEIQEFLIKR